MRLAYFMQILIIIFLILIFSPYISAQDTYTDDSTSTSSLIGEGCLGAGLCGFFGMFILIPILFSILHFACLIWIIYDGVKRKPTDNKWWIISILIALFLNGIIGALIWYFTRKNVPMQNPPPGGIQAPQYGFPPGAYPPQGMYPPPPYPPQQGQYPPPPPPP